MATLQVQDISLAFGDRDILDSVAFTLDQKSRASLAGANGSGKSTLMKILAGQLAADVYTVSASRDLRISYLPQSDIVFGEASLYEETEKAFSRFDILLSEQRELEDALVQEANEGQLLRLSQIHEILLEERYHDRRQIIETVLFGLGFSHEDLSRQCATFSGGWQMRIALAKILIEKPSIMLLDEPTNYLDIEARIWLKNYLKAYSGGIMLVSHDQGFLDATVDEVYELFDGKLRRYSGNYSAYLIQRKAEIAALESAGKAQAKLVERNEQFIERFRYKASKSRQVQSRIKMLEKLDEVKVPPHLRELSFSFAPAPPSGNDVVRIEELHKAYGPLVIYDDFSLWVNRGDRVAVTGRNGTGKSTLLRIIAGEDTEYDGVAQLGSNVSIGYFSQETGSSLDVNSSVLQEAADAAASEDQGRVRNLLGSFLFEGDDVFKSVGVLSGGEKSRLALLKILLRPSNLLILDEPTNHLDINAKRMLLNALSSFDGTMVFVSHDVYFIEELATKVLYLEDGRPPLLYGGGYGDFIAMLEAKEAVEEQPVTKAIPVVSEGQAAYRQANQIKNRIANLRKREEALLQSHTLLEERIAAVEVEMAKEENYSDGERIRSLVLKKENLEGQLANEEETWFSVIAERESLEESANA